MVPAPVEGSSFTLSSLPYSTAGLIKDFFFFVKIFQASFIFGLVTGNFVLIFLWVESTEARKSLSLLDDLDCFALVVLLSLSFH